MRERRIDTLTGHEHTREYWQYEYDVSSNSMVPLLEGWGVNLQVASVLDVGCGEGGGVCSLYDKGAKIVGFDVDAERIKAAGLLKGDREVLFTVGNLYEERMPFGDRTFDLVVLHDVFEHLDNKSAMLRKLSLLTNPEGRILITFPPYFSAYGAHQQHLVASFARLPFFHLLPFAISWLLPRLKGEHRHVVDEVQKLWRNKMGMKKFESLVGESGCSVVAKQAYLISPNHIRFGLKPIPAGPVAGIPLIGEVLCSGVVYLLKRE